MYRAVINFKLGLLDIYNEHFDYVDPHYSVLPPGGTAARAVRLSVGRRVAVLPIFNTVAIILAAYFRYGCLPVRLGGHARCVAAGDVLHRIGTLNTGVHQHQRLHPAVRCCSSGGLPAGGARNELLAGVAIGLTRW